MTIMAKLLGGLSVLTASFILSPDQAFAACAGGSDGPSTNVTRTFASGAKWSFNVGSAPCEGLVIRLATYTPFGGVDRFVLNRATLAEVHVPYDNNAARFLDVTDDTSGLGASALTLSAGECHGALIADNKICIEDDDHGYRWKYRDSFAEMHTVSVFMASQLGEYTYINRWVFHEDGTIEPMMGLTGRLQLTSGNAADEPQFGNNLNTIGQPVVIGLNHMHNFYYRLDFDLDGSLNDVVQRISYAATSSPPGCAGNACGRTSFTPITTEAAQTWSATGQQSWVIQDKSTVNFDGRRIGYEIKPHYSGIWRGKNDGTEPWAQHELFVTRYNPCERFAARNLPAYLGSGCSGAAANVSAMVNGESTDGQDVVIWFVNRHHHVTRDEDEFFMPIEWTGFHISPRSWYDSNPAP